MLDDINILKQRDPAGALDVASSQFRQANFEVELLNSSEITQPIENIIVTGMGGSALAALLAKTWLKQDLAVPIEIVRTYTLPSYIGKNTLVIASSYSGNTEETISGLKQAEDKGTQLAVITSGGELANHAKTNQLTHVLLPANLQPRMAVIYNLRALVAILIHFKLASSSKLDEIAASTDWLQAETMNWISSSLTGNNLAKQLAIEAVGKTAIFYGGSLTAPVAYKWKISWNENAKNVAFWNELPEFNHNEFIGWTSHPIEKPFAVFDIISSLEHPQILKRFKVSDQLLSGQRPKSTVINLAGDSLIKQMLWGSILADFTSIYLAILNNVDPTPVALIEKLKQALA
jgi:glucose/mannose-6-phosphate isomerase